MTRDQALAPARRHLAEAGPHPGPAARWALDEEGAEYSEHPLLELGVYRAGEAPGWLVPLPPASGPSWIGASHALLVVAGTGAVRHIQWGE